VGESGKDQAQTKGNGFYNHQEIIDKAKRKGMGKGEGGEKGTKIQIWWDTESHKSTWDHSINEKGEREKEKGKKKIALNFFQI